MPNEYSWLNSFINTDNLWINDSINWDDVLNITLGDLTLTSFVVSTYFANTQIFVDSLVKISLLDMLFLFETNKIYFPKELFNFLIWDLGNSFFINLFFYNFLFYTDFQNYFLTLFYYSPELILAVNDYFYYISTFNFFNNTSASVYDLFNDNLNSVMAEFLEYILVFFIFFWLIVMFVNIFQIIKWNNSIETYFTKITYYLYSLSKESRIQFEVGIQTLFFFFFYWTMMVATFDDDQEEIIELFDSLFFIFFIILIAYLVYKYSIHYFSFLEATDVSGRSVLFITKQFFKDFLGTFALLLRFFILLFRLNVYDNLDDFYDSYYIFIGDFDDDEYFTELFFSYHSLLFYEYDNLDDGSLFFEDESDFFNDLFYLYFLCWGKFFFFIFFILEEILRLSLAFYICYLIIFEVHAVNASYLEDNYFIKKRNLFEKKNTSKKRKFKI